MRSTSVMRYALLSSALFFCSLCAVALGDGALFTIVSNIHESKDSFFVPRISVNTDACAVSSRFVNYTVHNISFETAASRPIAMWPGNTAFFSNWHLYVYKENFDPFHSCDNLTGVYTGPSESHECNYDSVGWKSQFFDVGIYYLVVVYETPVLTSTYVSTSSDWKLSPDYDPTQLYDAYGIEIFEPNYSGYLGTKLWAPPGYPASDVSTALQEYALEGCLPYTINTRSLKQPIVNYASYTWFQNTSEIMLIRCQISSDGRYKPFTTWPLVKMALYQGVPRITASTNMCNNSDTQAIYVTSSVSENRDFLIAGLEANTTYTVVWSRTKSIDQRACNVLLLPHTLGLMYNFDFVPPQPITSGALSKDNCMASTASGIHVSLLFKATADVVMISYGFFSGGLLFVYTGDNRDGKVTCDNGTVAIYDAFQSYSSLCGQYQSTSILAVPGQLYTAVIFYIGGETYNPYQFRILNGELISEISIYPDGY